MTHLLEERVETYVLPGQHHRGALAREAHTVNADLRSVEVLLDDHACLVYANVGVARSSRHSVPRFQRCRIVNTDKALAAGEIPRLEDDRIPDLLGGSPGLVVCSYAERSGLRYGGDIERNTRGMLVPAGLDDVS